MAVFNLEGSNTNFISEILAGTTSFATMSYLLVECPSMFEHKNVAVSTVYFGMCIACFIGCLLMGLWAKQPFAVGPSLGLTAFFTAGLMTDMKYSFHEALAITFFAGIILVALSLTGIGNGMLNCLSGSMRNGVSAGVGIYITMIGMMNAGFISRNSDGIWQVADLSQRGQTFLTVIVMFGGLVFIGIFKKIGMPFPPFLAILVSTAIYYAGGRYLGINNYLPEKPRLSWFAPNIKPWYDEGFFRNMTIGIGDLFRGLNPDLKSALALVVTILVCSLFNLTESGSVVYAIAKNHGKLDDNGSFGAMKSSLGSCASASLLGTLIGCPMLSVAPESTAAICAQGKSGLTAVTTGVLFLLAAFFPPVASYIPPAITSCVMIYIGFTMLGSIKEIDCGDVGEGIPALFIIILIILTSSVIEGIALGIIIHIAVNLCALKFKAVKPMEFIIAFIFGLYYFII